MKDKDSIEVQQAEKELRKLEHEARVASEAGVTDVFERAAEQDFLAIDPLGVVSTKAEQIQSRKSGKMKFHSIKVDDERVRVYGGAAIVTGLAHVHGQHLGRTSAGDYRYTRMYVRRPGGWRLVSSQSTRVKR